MPENQTTLPPGTSHRVLLFTISIYYSSLTFLIEEKINKEVRTVLYSCVGIITDFFSSQRLHNILKDRFGEEACTFNPAQSMGQIQMCTSMVHIYQFRRRSITLPFTMAYRRTEMIFVNIYTRGYEISSFLVK